MRSTATDAQRKKDRDDFLRNFEMQSARADADPTGQSYQMYGRSVNLKKIRRCCSRVLAVE